MDFRDHRQEVANLMENGAEFHLNAYVRLFFLHLRKDNIVCMEKENRKYQTIDSSLGFTFFRFLI